MLHKNISWYVLIGEEKHGPYDYKTMIQMLQTNELMDYNHAWAEHLESWTPIHQLEEFSKDRFQILLQKESEYLNSFIQRKHARADVNISVLGHNTLRFFDGELISVSENGGLCMLNTPLVQVGDLLKLHIKPNNGEGIAFNVEAEVVRKNHSKNRINSKSALYYAVRFNDIQSTGVTEIKKWIAA